MSDGFKSLVKCLHDRNCGSTCLRHITPLSFKVLFKEVTLIVYQSFSSQQLARESFIKFVTTIYRKLNMIINLFL